MNQIYNSFIENVKKYKKIIIMAHRSVDLDGLSSSIGLSFFLKEIGTDAYVFNPETKDKNIKRAFQILSDHDIDVKLVSKGDLKEFNPENSLLIVIDTHKKSMLEYPKILELIPNVIVLDHHIKGPDAIEEPILSYINANMSSMVDLVIQFYQKENLSIDSSIATIMLAGMSIDTNNFRTKMSAHTYASASILLSMGADFSNVIRLLQEDKDEFILRNKFLKKAYLYKGKYMICALDNKIYTKKFLAQLADMMLEFNDVEASFTIGYVGSKTVGISARSIGEVNVQEIMQLFDGGGHITDAACQQEKTTIKKMKTSLEKKLEVII